MNPRTVRVICLLSLLTVICCVCKPVAAAVGFQFQSVSLVDFSQATFKSMLKRDYVIAPDVLAMDKRITLSIRAVEEKDVPAFVDGILASHGVSVTLRAGVYYLESKPVAAAPIDLAPSSAMPSSSTVSPVALVIPSTSHDPETVRELFVPQNRTVEFLASVLATAFGAPAVVNAGSGLVLVGSKVDVKKMRRLVGDLDQIQSGVQVSVAWVEVARTSGSVRGVSLALNVLGARLGLAVGSVNSGGALAISGGKFQAVLEALETDGRFKQVSNSRVVGDDREVMSLTVGDETPTISSTGKDNQGNSVQSVVYRPSGVILNVTPRLLGAGKINLVIDGQISSFKPTVTGVSGSPTLIKRQVKTAVTVAPGDVVVVGGLSDEQSNESRSGLSFLPSAWRGKSAGNVSTDLVLIVAADIAVRPDQGFVSD